MQVRESDDSMRDRRRGPSRLVQWSRARALNFWIAWPAFVLTLCLIAAGASYLIYQSPVEIKLALTRSNIIGLALALIVPPTCVTFVWHQMRRRRQAP